jgi:hypothetical protein
MHKEVQVAVETYGSDRVYNMDETPLKVCDNPRTAWCERGGKPPTVTTKPAGRNHQITCIACVSAAGEKLPIGVIKKGTTTRCLNSLGPLPSTVLPFF